MATTSLSALIILLPVQLWSAEAWQQGASPEELCPESKMPEEWRAKCLAGDLLWGYDLTPDAVHSAPDHKFLPDIGNGFIATKVHTDLIHVSSLFNGDCRNICEEPRAWCGAWSHRAAIRPYHVATAEEPVNSSSFKVGTALDVAEAVYLRRGVISGGQVQIDESWFAPYHEKSLLVHEIKLTNLGTEEQVVSLVSSEPSPSDDLDLSVMIIGDDDFYIAEGSTKEPEILGRPTTQVAFGAATVPESVTVPGGGEVIVKGLQAVETSLSSNSPTDKVRTLLSLYTQSSDAWSSLRTDHAAAWRTRAEQGHIEVQGDLALAQAVNASLYYIRSSFRPDWDHGMSPGGLASTNYNGHTFWDTETWMYPPILALEPEGARSQLRYRLDRIAESRLKAQECRPMPDGYNDNWPIWQEHGAMFEAFWLNNAWYPDHGHCTQSYTESPYKEHAIYFGWESAATGREVNWMDGRYGPWAMFQQHLMGDVAFAIRQYWRMTHDLDWLRDEGFFLLNGTASFYAARMVEREGSDGLYDIPELMGPNEFKFPINNSAFTNAVAKITLEFAADAAAELGYTDGGAYDRFRQLAAAIYQPTSDSPPPGYPQYVGGYTPEFEGFEEILDQCQGEYGCVKQADTILLNFPLGVEVDPTKQANDLNLYASITSPYGPAMTWSMFAINWIVLEDWTKAQENFQKGYSNMRAPYGVWSEYPVGTPYGDGAVNFITGAGGFLQSLIFGTSGMRIESDMLTFAPPRPSSVTGTDSSLILHSLHYLGSRLRQEVSANSVTFELLEAGPTELCVQSGDVMTPLEVGAPQTLDRAESSVAIKQCPTTTTTATTTADSGGNSLRLGVATAVGFALAGALCL